MRQEAERQDWEADSKNEGADEASRRANVDMLKQLTADTAVARRNKTDVKAAREAAKLARRAKLAARQDKRATGGSLAHAVESGDAQGADAPGSGDSVTAGQGDISALATLLSEEERRKDKEQRAALAAERAAALQAEQEARQADKRRG
jgi:hypothetical protein